MLSSCGAPANIRVLMECKQQRHPLQARADGSFGGCGFASDESPPSSNRFKGMRFQVTHLYICFFPDEHTWEACTDSYPMRVERHLCDIMHVPGKTGVITLKVIEHQLASKGCFRPDICSGVGDGGGKMRDVLVSTTFCVLTTHPMLASAVWATCPGPWPKRG